VRRQIDQLLGVAASGASADQTGSTFRAFMLQSPLGEVDLPRIERAGDWRREGL
jgi:hypothetical protein